MAIFSAFRPERTPFTSERGTILNETFCKKITLLQFITSPCGRPTPALSAQQMKANTPLMGQIVDATNIFTFGNSQRRDTCRSQFNEIKNRAFAHKSRNPFIRTGTNPSTDSKRWCPRSDSNRQASRRRILNPLRLPIPPLGHGGCDSAVARFRLAPIHTGRGSARIARL